MTPPPITRIEALGTAPLAAGEAARFFSTARFPGLDCLTATFRTHVYASHTHETYVVGVIDAGCETWNARGARHYAGPGEVLFNLPLDVHDGAPFGDGYTYRMTYPSVPFMQGVASLVSGQTVTATPTFKASVVRDPRRGQSARAAFVQDQVRRIGHSRGHDVHCRPPESEWRAALTDITPAMVAGLPFAALCGALAVTKGLSPAEVFAMSLVVFAGGRSSRRSRSGAIRCRSWRSSSPLR